MDTELQKVVLERQMALIENLGLFALKTLLTLNAGATVVLLALLGNLKSGGAVVADLPGLQSAMLIFLGGVFLVLVAVLVTYVLAQLEVGGIVEVGARWHLLFQVIAPALSFLCFAWGFYTATFAFSPIG